VLVEGGSLILSGDLEWQCQRQDAANSVLTQANAAVAA
jgi:hypothetical protein